MFRFFIERDTDGDSLPDRFEGHALDTRGTVNPTWDFQSHKADPDFFYVDQTGQLVVVRSRPGAMGDRVLWTYQVGTARDPIFTDVNGDGFGEFLLVTSDGLMRCIGTDQPQ